MIKNPWRPLTIMLRDWLFQQSIFAAKPVITARSWRRKLNSHTQTQAFGLRFALNTSDFLHTEVSWGPANTCKWLLLCQFIALPFLAHIGFLKTSVLVGVRICSRLYKPLLASTGEVLTQNYPFSFSLPPWPPLFLVHLTSDWIYLSHFFTSFLFYYNSFVFP